MTTPLNISTLDAGVSLVCFRVEEMIVCLHDRITSCAQSECTDDSNGAGAGNSGSDRMTVMSYVLLPDNHRDVDTLHYLTVSGTLVFTLICDSKRQSMNMNKN